MEKLGASPADIAGFLSVQDGGGEGEDAETVFVLAENADPWRIFDACRTQWRWTSLSTLGAARMVRTGLDYLSAEAVARALKIAWDEPLLADLRFMEIIAINAWSEQRPRT